MYRGADKSLARPTSRCILFDGDYISFDASLVIYINSTNIPPIMIICSMEHGRGNCSSTCRLGFKLLSLWFRVRCCEHGNGHSTSIKAENVFD